jgi:class 3 adenylate cyclase
LRGSVTGGVLRTAGEKPQFLGSGEAQEHDVVGETPNLAARLQTLAQPGTVVIASTRFGRSAEHPYGPQQRTIARTTR